MVVKLSDKGGGRVVVLWVGVSSVNICRVIGKGSRGVEERVSIHQSWWDQRHTC
jgi:hypothetical protein